MSGKLPLACGYIQRYFKAVRFPERVQRVWINKIEWRIE